MLKKIISIFLICTILLSVVTYAAETSPKAVNELNAIGIVKGDGKSFNLNAQLKRSEATTIIARVLGVEKKILNDQAYYAGLSTFDDVKKTDWFAPYVGYMVNTGIVNGYPDGTFRPEQYVSEKEMLKMILSVLGYSYGDDYKWASIYFKSLEWKVLKDTIYEQKTEDDFTFTREECFLMVRTVLEASYKAQDDTIISKWIKDGVYTSNELKLANIAIDQLISKITKVEAMNETTVKVTLNENIQSITKDAIKITTTSNVTLLASAVTVKDNVLTITTAPQTKALDYNIVISSVVDADQIKVENLTASFKGYTPSEIVSDNFLISKIEPVSKDTIKVYFTQEISAVPTIATFYEIYQGNSLWLDGDSNNLYVAQLTDSKKGVIIRLKNTTFNFNSGYSLKVAGTMTDFTGVRMNNGTGDTMAFTSFTSDNVELKRERTYGYYKDIVTVEFNKAVDVLSGETTGNFQILDSNNNVKVGVPKINPNDPKQILIGMLEPLVPGATYKLNMVNPIYDLERATSKIETGIEFTVADVTREALKINLVEVVSNSELRVYFNKSIKPSSIDLSRFRITSLNDGNFAGVNLFDKFLFDPVTSPSSVTLYLNPSVKKLSSSGLYSLSVTDDLKDYLGQSNGELVYSINGSASDKVSPEISSGIILGSNLVRLEFNKPVSNTNTTANFKLIYKKADNTVVEYTPSLASVFNNKYVVLQFSEALDATKVYRIQYLTLNDYREDTFVGGSAKEFLLDFGF